MYAKRGILGNNTRRFTLCCGFVLPQGLGNWPSSRHDMPLPLIGHRLAAHFTVAEGDTAAARDWALKGDIRRRYSKQAKPSLQNAWFRKHRIPCSEGPTAGTAERCIGRQRMPRVTPTERKKRGPLMPPVRTSGYEAVRGKSTARQETSEAPRASRYCIARTRPLRGLFAAPVKLLCVRRWRLHTHLACQCQSATLRWGNLLRKSFEI